MKTRVILKFEDVHEQNGKGYRLRRLRGEVSGTSLVNLLSVADLKANPRQAKANDITEEIIESLNPNTGEVGIFHYKTKGLLLAAHFVKPLERQRYELDFADEDELTSGILDGGHNLLAIGTHMIREASGNPKLKFKYWDDLREAWNTYKGTIEEVKASFNFMVPVEVIYPADDDAAALYDYERAILEVCSARNNNVQVNQEAHDNKAGIYDDLKAILPKDLAERVEWRTGEGKPIKVRDLLSLLWIPLLKLELPEEVSATVKLVNDTQIYNSKQACSDAFGDLVRHSSIAKEITPNQRKIVHEGVLSALRMLPELVDIYDQVSSDFPRAYNNVSPGFGRIRSVDSSKFGKTKFWSKDVEARYPDGFIVPLMVALREMMEVVGNKLQWRVKNPVDKVKHLMLIDSLHEGDNLMRSYVDRIKNMDYDPQRFAKSSNHYKETARDLRDYLRS